MKLAAQAIVLVLCAIMAAHFAFSQETVNRASLSGRVTDPSGAVIVGAQVTARQMETNLTSSATTDSEGRFRYPYLNVGVYEVRVHAEGFADISLPVTLTVGAAFDLPIALAIASDQTEVSVSGEAPVLE